MNNKNGTVKWIYNRAITSVPSIILISLLNAFSALILFGVALLSKNIMDSFGAVQNNLIFEKIFLLFGLIFTQVMIDSAVSMISVSTSTKINMKFRNHMFTVMLKKKYSNITEYHSGELLNRFSSDVDQVVNGCVGLIPNIISILTKIIAGIAALCIQKYYMLAILIIIVGFFFPLLGRVISKKYKKLHKEVQRTEGETRSFLQECFANIIVIKSFLGEKTFLKKLDEYMNVNRSFRIKRNLISLYITMGLYLCFTFGYYAVMIWGASKVANATLTAGTLIYFLQLISMLKSPLQSVSGILPKFYLMTASAERLIQLEALENEQVPKDELINAKFNFKNIKASNLSFAYNNRLIIKDCSFTIEKNTITAITGESGSGKSTLFRLLLGLYEPTYGSLTFNGEIPINETTKGMFSYVPQGNMVLSGSIRENITLGNEDVTDDKIMNAAKAAVIYDFIISLPEGLDTKLSERGIGLSEGQIQRICIARALLFDAPIILLDESTSALDEETESLLLKNLKLFTDKTIVFITHRNTSLDSCDKILHLEDGNFTTVK